MNTDSTRSQQSPWLRSLVQQRLTRSQFILAIPVSCLIASLCSFGWLQFQTAKAEYWVRHTHQVRLEAKRLLASLLEAEAEVRGYEITRGQQFIVSYESARTKIFQSFESLNRLVADNPSQLRRFQQVRDLAQTRLSIIERILQFVKAEPEEFTRSPEFISQVMAGKQAMDKTTTEINRFLTEEERLQGIRDEYLRQQRQLTWLALGLSAGLGMGGSIFAAYLLNRLEHRLARRDRRLRESEARYRLLIENFPNGAVLLLDPELRYLLADGTALATGGQSKEQLEGKTIWEVWPPEYSTILEPAYREALAGTPTTAEFAHGDRFYNIQALPLRNESGEIFAGMVVRQDITERKLAEKQLYQLNRSLKTLSECNQALVRARDETTLLHDICQNIVEFGGYHSTWIGLALIDETKTVRPAAQVGFPEGYLESLEIRWSDTEQGHGPVGTAIRTRSPIITQNVLTESTYAPWRDSAIRRGYASSISLPLIVDNLPLGVLNIYASESDAFDEAEVKLLTELANDLAYGIKALRTQAERQQVEESLRDSEAKFRAFLESASEAIIVSSTNGEIVLFNAKAEELFGYDHTEVLGRQIEVLIPERYHHNHLRYRAEYQEQPNKRSMGKTKNLFARRKDETEFPIEAGLSAISTKNGLFVMTFLTDITERKKAEEEIRRLNKNLEQKAAEIETRYQQIVELAEEGIWVIDSVAKTTYVNQAMAKMLGYTEEEMLGRSIFDFMSEAERQIAQSNVEQRKQGVAEKHEFKLKTKGGKTVWTYMSTSPVLDESGNLLWSCALVYDITERKQTEEQLHQSTERISLANAELARATRLKDEFLASMSHELRTPLNAILGLSEALKEEVFGPLTERQNRSLTTIEQSGQHLLDLINDILDLSKIESGKMEFQVSPVSLKDLCESSLTFVKQQAHQKKIQISSKITEDVGNIEVDERRIRQVLINLLSNAVKFTPEGGLVCLEAEADAESEVLHFRVIDTGIGIAPENIDKLFQPFVQLDSSLSRRYAGTGLGLALVQRIVELHSGSISLESEVGKGSTFTVTLPWKESEQMRQGSLQNERVQEEFPDINQALIVEDSEAAATQVARYLTELGTVTHIHPCGEGTVEAALNIHPDVIVLDILLPNLSGWDVLSQLKENPATKDIPVLVVSVVEERSHTLSLGASEYLVKPFSRQQLHSTLSKIFSETSVRSNHAALVVMPESQRQPPLILLAEDNEANIATLMDYLQAHDFRVSLARNGIEAVELAKQQKPDLILMDIQMPQMDGLQATRLIRMQPDLVTIPIIALTALAMPGDRQRCLASGATDYLTKPVGLKKLMNIIAQHLNLISSE